MLSESTTNKRNVAMYTEQEKFMWFEDNIKPKIYKIVRKLNGGKPIWYEVGIDLDEQFMRWFDFAFKYPNLAAYPIARWMIRRDRWYWSPSYVAELDKAMTRTDNPSEALCMVLDDSLKR